jgi:hypothetical protein
VAVVARRLGSVERHGWSRIEIAIVAIGPLLALSYWLKATVAIPALTLLMFSFIRLRRGLGRLIAFAVALALATPLVYLVRGTGSLRFGELLTSQYWSEFFSTLTSRFFHYESLMIAVPYPASERPWQPIVDFFVTFVPRVLWEGKPLSASARFTQEHLLAGLHSPTDVGVISLPGELWLVGGGAGVVTGGLVIGVLLRTAWALASRANASDGTLLVAATLIAGLVFLNDGWGLASAVVSVLIAACGWLIMLRLDHRREPE